MSSLDIPPRVEVPSPQAVPFGVARPAPAAPRLVRAVPALVLCGVMGVGLCAAVAQGLSSVEWSDFSPGQLLDSEHRRGLSSRLTTNAYAQAAGRLGREANWLVLRDLGPQVRQGCPGWLFLTDELRVHRNAADHAATRVQALARVARALDRRGVRLVVAVVPDKSRVEARQLCGLPRSTAFEGRVSRFVLGLQGAGVTTVDLTPVLADAPIATFMRTDTHWNEAGSRLAAQAVALGARATGVPLPAAPAPRITEHSPAPRTGDLVRLAGIDQLPAAWQPARDVLPQSTVAAAAAVGNDLFDDAALPQVALIGTSFSRNANFGPFLATALNAAVANFARDGGNFSGAAQAYFASAAFRQNPPRLLLWEVPERTIEMPADAPEAAWLPVAETLDAAPPAAPTVSPASRSH